MTAITRLLRSPTTAAGLALAAPMISGHLSAVSGGVTQLKRFRAIKFPAPQGDTKTDQYCKLNDKSLAFYGISHHITGAIAAPISAIYVSRSHRHKDPILVGAVFLGVGAFLQLIPTGTHPVMLITGRLVQGIGFGFLNQAHSYLAEMVPEDGRVPLVFLVQGCTKAGAMITNLQNYLTVKYGDEGNVGWSLSLSLIPLVFAAIFIYACIRVLPDTPRMLILVSNDEAGARRLLKLIRETENDDDVQKEVDVISACASMETSQTTTFLGSLKLFFVSLKLLKKEHIPALVTGVLVSIFTQLVGANMAGPITVQAIGFISETALLIEFFRSLLDFGATLLMVLIVDKKPRKVVLTCGGIGVLFSLFLIGAVKASGLEGTAHDVLCFIAIIFFERGFSAIWAPLAVLIPSEIYPSEIQSLGQGLSALASSISAALIGFFYIPLLCHLKYWIFFVLAAVMVVAIVWVQLLLPETSGVLPEQMPEVWSRNRLWKKFMPPKENHDEESAITDSPIGTSFSSVRATNYTGSSSDDTASVSSLSEANENDQGEGNSPVHT